MPSATQLPRVPAWQRLGLKLKFAQTAEVVADPPQGTQSLKRKTEDKPDETPLKKAKSNSQASLGPTHSDDPTTPVLTRKKSVTFTPETKVDDGDSIKQLFNAWLAEQKSQDPNFQLDTSNKAFEIPEAPVVEEEIDTTLAEDERRVKRVKKIEDKAAKSLIKTKKSKSEKPSIATKLPARPFLTYLRQYCESRENWKFNKNHQNHLLKNIFNIEVILSDHIHLVYEYIKGLQGGVRTRLRDSALAIKVKDLDEGAAGFPEDMENRDKRQKEYDTAMKDYVATMNEANSSLNLGYEEGILLRLSDAAMRPRVAKRMRTEEILKELALEGGKGDLNENAMSNGLGQEGESQKRLRMNDGSTLKTVRRRKQRTMATEDETTSSDDSSDSESSSSEEESVPGSKQNAPASTSSTSSSSSSSTSESESDSEDGEEDTSNDSSESD